MSKKIILLFVALLPMLLTACYDKEEIDNITYVIALGIDKGKKENLKLTMQYFTINEKLEDSVGNEGTASICVEAPSIISAVNIINNSIDRKLSFSHTKLIVMSQELAKEGGLIKILKPLENSKEFRPNIYMAVSKGEAEKYLKAIEELKKPNIARYYRLMFSAYNYSGYYMATQRDDFYYELCDEDVGSVVPYVAVNELKKGEDIGRVLEKNENSKKKEGKNGEFRANNMPERGKDAKIQIIGIAIFDNDRMVGVATGKEVTHLLLAAGGFNRSFYTIKDPMDKDKNISITLIQKTTPNVNVVFKDGKPLINIDIKVNGEYVYFESDVDYDNEKKNAILVNYIENIMAARIKEVLEKTAKIYKSDICMFAKVARRNFLTWQEWEKCNWKDKYKDAQFNVKVNLKIKMRGMIRQ